MDVTLKLRYASASQFYLPLLLFLCHLISLHEYFDRGVFKEYMNPDVYLSSVDISRSSSHHTVLMFLKCTLLLTHFYLLGTRLDYFSIIENGDVLPQTYVHP